jgi:septum formation inhibitor-activating ATPase MinD/DNA-binding NarL/FixJ family response regulator
MKKIFWMEVNKIKKIITAIGNPFLNNKLKKINNLEILNKDIQYQEGIFEIMEINKKIDYLILNQLLPGDLNIEELIEKIQELNPEIKIIIILEKIDEKIKNVLLKKGIYRIINNRKNNFDNLINIINADEKMQKYNEEIQKEINEIKKYNLNKKLINKKIKEKSKLKEIKNKINYCLKKNNKNNFQKINNKKNIITILGNDGSGKSIFSILFSLGLKNYFNKILILDFDFTNKSIHSILGVKKQYKKIINNKNNINNLTIKINKKIDLISNIDFLFNGFNNINYEKIKIIINDLIKKYDAIIIDTGASYLCEKNKNLINLSDYCIFITEANLVQLSKSKKILEYYFNKLNIPKNKIKIVFNKYNFFCIKNYILKKIYFDYEIIGFINYSKKINYYINKNFRNILIEKNISKKAKKIINKLFFNNKGKGDYYANFRENK